jgi:lipopolysaccharide transport system ATP-binding protein
MSDTVISIENISKTYQLGAIGTGTFYGDLQRWWARQRGLPDPFLKVGEKDHGNRDGETVWALKDINFEVKRGEAVGIIGRNGAGKSTLLKILSRVTAPTSGEIKVKGRVASLLEVGTGFHPELTGRENIFLNSAILGMNRHETGRKLDEIVDFSGVEKYIDTPVKRYSSGMYVRLAFAVAAHLDPEILVVDEVLAVGDAEFQKKCLGKMGDVTGEGRTVLFVSHNMTAIQRLCDRSIWLQKGSINAAGETSHIIGEYLSQMSGLHEENIAEIPRKPGFGEKARIMDAWTLNKHGERSSSFKFGEAVTVHLDVQAPDVIDNLSLIVGVDAAMDYRIATAISGENGTLFSVTPTSPLSVDVSLAGLRLKPGTYYLTFGIRRNKFLLDRAIKALRFEVTGVTEDGSYQETEIRGDIFIDADWQWAQEIS